MVKQFNDFGITNYEFITDYDKDHIPEFLYNRFININENVKSIFSKQIESLKHFLKTEDNICIVVEDDIIFDKNILQKINQVIEELKDDDNYVVFCSDSCNIHTREQIVPERIVYKAHGTRGLGFQIITRKAAQIIINRFDTCGIISIPADHWFNQFVNNINYYYSEPYIGLQGSENGTFLRSYL